MKLISIRKQSIIFIVMILFLTSCAALGTKTLSKSNELKTLNFNKIGISQPINESALNQIVANTSDIYQNTVDDFIKNTSIKLEKVSVKNVTSINEIGQDQIKELCKINNLDAIIFSEIKYKFTTHSYTQAGMLFFFIPLGKSEDVYVTMFMYGKNGNKLIHVRHNTLMGNSYMMPPKADKTIKDGTLGALKRIIAEIQKKHDS